MLLQHGDVSQTQQRQVRFPSLSPVTILWKLLTDLYRQLSGFQSPPRLRCPSPKP